MLKVLESLEIFHCAVTNECIKHLYPEGGADGLSYIGLTGCNKVHENRLKESESNFYFSILDISETFVGYIPRRSVQELRKAAQIHVNQYKASLLLQRISRGFLVRFGIFKKRRKEWTGKSGLRINGNNYKHHSKIVAFVIS